MNADDCNSPLRCRVESRGNTVYVAAIGEIDLDTAPRLQDLLYAAREAGFETVVLDLRGTTFMDSTGLHLALEWDERARRERFAFALMHGPGPVQRVIDLAGVRGTLTFREAGEC